MTKAALPSDTASRKPADRSNDAISTSSRPSASTAATAGSPTDIEALRVVKDAAGTVPVFVNTGVRAENVATQLAVADGAVVGTYFKKDGVFANAVDKSRVQELMGAAREFRAQLV